ncbi:putative nucleotidyltransferase with HDIG domain [Alkalibaculum bacchi]|uniref:Putative nucleotidyltransferase with HDIG domain n=2 Tax=Alkalibaculum bacchi TaxID=645887 RepID=A0A366IEG1_9FIRM|nr:putative nucleotidyltransferase with HDIG domain [Alkalibaculum bacchi]
MTDSMNFFEEIEEHLLNDSKPSEYLNSIKDNPEFKKHPFDYLNKLIQTEQSPKYHPEGSVWNHTMLVIDGAAKVKNKSKNKRAFMWAALLHDIGKPSTTRKRKGKITSYDHDKVGSELAEEFLLEVGQDEEFIKEVTALVRYHMQILFVLNNLPFADISSMKDHVDINEIALLGYCDRMGRLNADSSKEQKNIEEFIRKVTM